MVATNSADLDRRIAIQQRTVSRNSGDGSQAVTWSTEATVWGRIRESATAGDEQLRDGAMVHGRPTLVRIRYRGNVTTDKRLSFGGRLYQITGVAEVGRREFLDIACKEWSHE